MINGEAFISEIKAYGFGEGSSQQEYLEITISKTADLNDYTLSFYKASTHALTTGYLTSQGKEGSGSSFFANQAEVTLADIANMTGTVANPVGSVSSTIGGRALQIAEHPDNPDYWIILVPFSGATNDSHPNSVSIIALTNTVTSESEVYNLGGGSTAALLDGAAAGETPTPVIGPNIQVDYLGTITTFAEGAETPLQSEVPSVLCFASDARIEVSGGTRAAGELRIGDLVTGLDGAQHPVRWIGRRAFGASELAACPRLRPVRITAGALGGGLPRRDLLVSRQHRMLIRSDIAARMFDTREVLVPAIKLVLLPGIFVDDAVQSVEYIHILCDRHEVIFAEGAPAETLLTGPEALRTLTPEMRAELALIFPEIWAPGHTPAPIRYIPPNRLLRKLVDRHLKNGKGILDLAVPDGL